MKKNLGRSARSLAAALMVAAVLLAGSCAGTSRGAKKTAVVTYSILGSAVRELVGDALEVVVLVPDGLDPHEWEPSAKDIETINKATLIVQNGLGLEEGMKNALTQARAAGVKIFTASDHIDVRTVGKGEGIPSGDPDQAAGARDPHLWTDPRTMKAVIDALADYFRTDLGIDLSRRRADFDARLDAVDAEIATKVETIPEKDRRLVTGHESMGYFARRYGFKLVGAVVPNLSSQAESSAGELEALRKMIAVNDVSVIFTELGENPKVAKALADDAKLRAVPLLTHSLPKEGGYLEFIRGLASTIVEALKR
jgi:zinc/manganese transport system substrate-binding protein